NLSGNLAAGDTFTLFTAGRFTGNFSTVSLPSLGPGLAWNTNSLTNGVLSVISTVAPQFGSITPRPDGNYDFTGTGASNTIYDLVAATNLSPPVAWLLITSATANATGNFQLSDLQATNFPIRFYRITSQQ
ncbi:MAG TPA: hypothetical protein VME24_10295, partial [Alphaproteobacteria bacterium]|nr:hypothetical protein [Alphaproteobacteria bacterium]